MDKNDFWQLIEASYQKAERETDRQMEILINKLSQCSQVDILRFGKIYEIYARESYQSKLWAAAYIMNGGCSDDGFDYFRGWLISRGKEPYLNALIDPDSISELDMPSEDEDFENEEMLYVALKAFSKNRGSDDYAYYQKIEEFELDPSEVTGILDEISFGEDIDVDWDEEEDTLVEILPKLYERYW